MHLACECRLQLSTLHSRSVWQEEEEKNGISKCRMRITEEREFPAARQGMLKKHTIYETMAGNGGGMAQARTQELLELVRDTQTSLLDYLRRADERQERQNHAVLT